MLYVASDTHGTIHLDTLRPDNFPSPVTRGDYLLLCGDVGLVWDGAAADRQLMEWYDAQPYTTLYIDGNHENHDLLSRLPISKWKGGRIHRLGERVVHLLRGEVYQVDGQRFFCFGGGFSVKKVTGGSKVPIWEGEMPSQQEYSMGLSNLAEHGHEVDYIFTHTCPTSCLAHLPARHPPFERELNDYLERISREVRWKNWYFGHFHVDMDIGRFRTLHRRVLRVA